MNISRTVLTLMTGTAIALSMAGYGNTAAAAADDLFTSQAFERRVQQLKRMPGTAPDVQGQGDIEINLDVLGPSTSTPASTATSSAPSVANDGFPETIVISSETHPGAPEDNEKDIAASATNFTSPLLTTPLVVEPVAAKQPVIAAAAKAGTVSTSSYNAPGISITVEKEVASATSSSAGSSADDVSLPPVMAAIAPAPVVKQPIAVKTITPEIVQAEIVQAEPPALPPEAEEVIAQIASVPANAPRPPEAGAPVSFPIKIEGKTQPPAIDRILMQTGRIESDTITTQKIASTDPSIPPVPASPATPVTKDPIVQKTETPKAVEKRIVKVEAVKKPAAPEKKPEPIILSKAKTVSAPTPDKKPALATPATPDTMAAIAPAAGTPITGKAEETNVESVKEASTIPVPPHRPAIQNASVEFVERARRTYRAGEVYRRGDDSENRVASHMASVTPRSPNNYKGGAIPAPTLSVADLGHDPLARQVVDMSVEDIAATLNNIETAAGTRAMNKPAGQRTYGNTHPYDEMPIVQRGFVFRPKVEDIATQSDTAVTAASRPLSVPPPPPAAARPTQQETPSPIVLSKDASIDAAALNAIAPAARGDDAAAEHLLTPPSPVSLSYDKGAGTVADEVLAQTMGDLVAQMKTAPTTRVQIVAFASPAKDGASSARRTSLSRALNVRAWMIGQGIEASRMDVRALGVSPDQQDLDRVDMIMVAPATR